MNTFQNFRNDLPTNTFNPSLYDWYQISSSTEIEWSESFIKEYRTYLYRDLLLKNPNIKKDTELTNYVKLCVFNYAFPISYDSIKESAMIKFEEVLQNLIDSGIIDSLDTIKSEYDYFADNGESIDDIPNYLKNVINRKIVYTLVPKDTESLLTIALRNTYLINCIEIFEPIDTPYPENAPSGILACAICEDLAKYLMSNIVELVGILLESQTD